MPSRLTEWLVPSRLTEWLVPVPVASKNCRRSSEEVTKRRLEQLGHYLTGLWRSRGKGRRSSGEVMGGFRSDGNNPSGSAGTEQYIAPAISAVGQIASLLSASGNTLRMVLSAVSRGAVCPKQVGRVSWECHRPRRNCHCYKHHCHSH